MKLQTLSYKRNSADVDRLWCQLLPLFYRGLLVTAILLNGKLNAGAQSPESDTTSNNPDQTSTYAKLGARFALGGLYGFGMDQGESNIERLKDERPKYGVRAGVLIPFGAKCDFEAVSDYVYFPGWTNYSNQSSDLPSLKTGNLRVGIRFYPRGKELERRIAAMGWRIRHMFWRDRVDRRGFHFGVNMGAELGWHKRIIRSIPENWPMNEVLTESDMEHNVLAYTRWYWHGCIQLGWTFNGRVDFTVGMDAAARIGDYDERANREFLGDINGRAYLTGCVSLILGRSHIKKSK